jgi:hypothetical protein
LHKRVTLFYFSAITTKKFPNVPKEAIVRPENEKLVKTEGRAEVLEQEQG